MLKAVKEARSALALLNPEEVRNRARRPVRIGLIAAGDSGYTRMEEFFAVREARSHHVFRASDPEAPDRVDLVLYEPGLDMAEDAYPLDLADPHPGLAQIIREHDDLALTLARQVPVFRGPAVDRFIHTTARENALFAIATALPDVIPNLMEMPWAFGEWASDTAFITANQVRMAFQIAAACGREVGFARQKFEILSIGAGAFGWRAIARELVGKIPFGGGLIPKGAIAYAGTFVVGKALERLYAGRPAWTLEERKTAYREALENGKSVAGSVVEPNA
jgi:hypothetical protein